MHLILIEQRKRGQVYETLEVGSPWVTVSQTVIYTEVSLFFKWWVRRELTQADRICTAPNFFCFEIG